jgi:hypothetical protein
MPETMANWLMETMRPRMRAGEISAMYIGEVIDAAPTPTPPMTRKTTKVAKLGGNAVPMADARNMTAAMSRTFLRPRASLRAPAEAAPIAQPSSALEAAHPLYAAVSAKRFSRNPIAPEMTAVS